MQLLQNMNYYFQKLARVVDFFLVKIRRKLGHKDMCSRNDEVWRSPILFDRCKCN